MAELEQPLRRVEVLQVVVAQVAQLHAVGQLVSHHLANGVGEQHLAAVGGGGDPGRLVDVEGDVPCSGRVGLAGVGAHAHPDLDAVGPLVGDQGPLGVEAGGNRRAGPAEGHEEAVSLGLDLDAAVGGEGRPQQPAVLLQQLAVALVPDVAEQAGGALDVGEQERDRSARQLRHPLPIPLPSTPHSYCSVPP